MTGLEFIVMILAVHRVTHLITVDEFPLVRKPREWVDRKWPESSFSYFVGCVWCAGVWVASAAAFAVFLWGPAAPVGWRDYLWYPVLAAALASAEAIVETVVQRVEG